ncbi:Pc20g11960 [Penicillium rubens Wisconsin 54-1255]|uniref:Pc20g11960 protein n=1 Tax=Penicillium rubens (strain ATCC 28089 / DSM 1075 / NRRL 1951 / Wisconsin 54-1255) TaxID=500485 RepID=B6HDK8_PENRW|nr:Pc20g11960 [Penicillium rubens Wisconsin 54-1255]
MSPDSKISKSIFAKRPVKIVVGSDERVYYVHRGTLEVHPSFDARLKASTDEYEEAIDWSGFDEQTIDCVLNFLYSGGYQAPQATSVAAEDEQPSPPDSPQSQPSWPHSPTPIFPVRARSLSPVAESSIGPDSPPTQALSECDLNDRPLTPLEYCDGVTLATDHEKQDQHQVEPEQETEGHTAAEIYLHAKVYSFASQLDFEKLEQFALNRLAQVLVALEQTDKAPFPYLVDAIRLIYKTTSTVDGARNLLSQFVALRYTTLAGEDLDELITEGGEFVVDLSHKLARRLTTTAMAFKKVEYLTHRNEELKAESAEKDKELKALREEVRPEPAQGFPAFTYQI